MPPNVRCWSSRQTFHHVWLWMSGLRSTRTFRKSRALRLDSRSKPNVSCNVLGIISALYSCLPRNRCPNFPHCQILDPLPGMSPSSCRLCAETRGNILGHGLQVGYCVRRQLQVKWPLPETQTLWRIAWCRRLSRANQGGMDQIESQSSLVLGGEHEGNVSYAGDDVVEETREYSI